MSDNVGRKYVWKMKPSGGLAQIAPVQNQWYDVVDLKGGTKITVVTIGQQNNEVATKNVELEITIDDNVPIICQANAVTSNVTWYVAMMAYAWETIVAFSGAAFPAPCFFGPLLYESTYHTKANEPFECSNFKVRARLTSAQGTSQYLNVFVDWAKLEAV